MKKQRREREVLKTKDTRDFHTGMRSVRISREVQPSRPNAFFFFFFSFAVLPQSRTSAVSVGEYFTDARPERRLGYASLISQTGKSLSRGGGKHHVKS